MRKKEKNSDILVIANRYKNTLNDLIDSSDPDSSPKLIDERFCNTPRSGDSLTSFLNKNCFYKNVLALDRLSQLPLKIGNSHFHQYYAIALFDPKNGRT